MRLRSAARVGKTQTCTSIATSSSTSTASSSTTAALPYTALAPATFTTTLPLSPRRSQRSGLSDDAVRQLSAPVSIPSESSKKRKRSNRPGYENPASITARPKKRKEPLDASEPTRNDVTAVGTDGLFKLPYENLLNIIYQADYASATALRQTSKVFLNIVTDNRKSILVNWSKIHLLDNYQQSFSDLTMSQKIIRAFLRSQFADTVLNAVDLHNANPENRTLSCSRERLQALALCLDEIKLDRRNPDALLEGRMPAGMNHVLIFGGMITCTTLLKRQYYTEVQASRPGRVFSDQGQIPRVDESALRTAVVRLGIEWTAKVLTIGNTHVEYEAMKEYTHDSVSSLRIQRLRVP